MPALFGASARDSVSDPPGSAAGACSASTGTGRITVGTCRAQHDMSEVLHDLEEAIIGLFSYPEVGDLLIPRVP